jgi:hypothetical protein
MKVHNLLVTGSLTSGGENITEIAGTVTDLSSSLLTAMNDMSSSIKGMMATTGSNLFKGTQTLSGSIIPAVDNAYDLGSVTHQFRDLYLSSASLYIDGVKVLGSTAQELQITTDAGQSFKILEAGSDTITLQSNDGNITLATSGGGDVIMDPTNGIIALKGTTTVYAGNRILSSDGNNIHFGNGVIISGSLIATGTNLISGSSQILNGSGIVSSSAQVTGYGFSTTGSNAFIGTQTITGSLYISSDLVVQGSSSLQNITASVVNIGANIVNLNTANPAIRFAGLNIFDSGSIGGSGSFLYDAVQDEFIFIHRGDGTNTTSSVVLMGPQTYNNVGSETYPTNNRILKGTGNEHIGDSIISETNEGIGISGSLSITGSVLVGIDKGIIFDSSGASGNPEISIDSNVDLNFKNSAGLTNLKLKNNGDTIISGSLSLTGNITSTGNVGVGNTSPSAKLDIEANSSTWTARVINTNTTTNNAGLLVKAGVNSGNEIILAQKANGTSVFLVDASGNVGIGTTSPGSKLHVEGGEIRATTTNGGVALYRTGDTGEVAAYNWGGSAYLNLNLVGLYHTFSTSGTERMRITSTGNVGIGTTSPTEVLHLNKTSGTGTFIRFQDTGGGGVYIGGRNEIMELYAGGAERMRITSGGNVGVGTNSPSGRLHVTTTGITASAPSLGWPVHNAELDTNARSIFFDTAGNGSVGTASQGASLSLILGQYFDSRVIITTPGAGGSSPSDQGTGRGRDMMIKAGTADNTVGYSGGRLYLNGGIGYGAGGFNTNGGHIIMQGLTGSGNVGINDTNPQTKLSINGANYIEMATFTCTPAASTTIVTDNAGYVQFSNGTARHLSNSSIFTSVTDGIRILKAGIVQVTVSQDITTAGTTGYVLLYIQKNKSTVSENLITNTNGEWDGINGVATIAVAADDVINFYYSAVNILSLDAGSWSQYSFIWASR